jgi:predicted nucleic acid-binding protein
MAALKALFFDTSVLIAGVLDLGPASEPAQRIMTAVAAGALGRPRTAWHCCLEFYAVCTRLPEELRLTPAQASQLLASEIRQRLEVVGLPARAWAGFWDRVEAERVAGGRVYDAHIAEVARTHKARVVVTDNLRHFTSLTTAGIEVVSSRDFSEQL